MQVAAADKFAHQALATGPTGGELRHRIGRAVFGHRTHRRIQWRDDSGKLSVDVPDDVLTEDKIRPALRGDPADLGGEEAFAGCSGLLSGNAVVLAGVARSEDMNEAAPRSSVEGEHVRPDRSRMKPPCFHRRDQARGGCNFPLHEQYRASERHRQTDAKFEPADSGAEGQDVSGT